MYGIGEPVDSNVLYNQIPVMPGICAGRRGPVTSYASVATTDGVYVGTSDYATHKNVTDSKDSVLPAVKGATIASFTDNSGVVKRLGISNKDALALVPSGTDNNQYNLADLVIVLLKAVQELAAIAPATTTPSASAPVTTAPTTTAPSSTTPSATPSATQAPAATPSTPSVQKPASTAPVPPPAPATAPTTAPVSKASVGAAPKKRKL